MNLQVITRGISRDLKSRVPKGQETLKWFKKLNESKEEDQKPLSDKLSKSQYKEFFERQKKEMEERIEKEQRIQEKQRIEKEQRHLSTEETRIAIGIILIIVILFIIFKAIGI